MFTASSEVFNMCGMVYTEWGVLGFFHQRRAKFTASTAFQRVGGGLPQHNSLRLVTAANLARE